MLIASALDIAKLFSESCFTATMFGIARNVIIPMMATAARTSTNEKTYDD